MTSAYRDTNPVEILLSARRVANLAASEGAERDSGHSRSRCSHLGAILADSVLQAGLNYSTVVLPRVTRILSKYPGANSISELMEIVQTNEIESFLDWRHPTKLNRFKELVVFIEFCGINDASDLRTRLVDDEFCVGLQEIRGVGPKTVDYLSCLVGIESIAVDRHIRTYAKRAGVEQTNYYFLRRVFCFAADFLDISRREFDAWIWRRESRKSALQLSFDLA